MRLIAFILVLFAVGAHAQDDAVERIMQRLRALNQHAAQAQNQGDYVVAEERRRQIISLMEQINFPQQEFARELSNLASVLNRVGKPSEAQSLCERALAILEEFPTNDPVQEAVLLGNLGTALRLQGELTFAQRRYNEELSILESLDMSETHYAASAIAGLGAIEAAVGNLEEAKSLYESALPIFLEISDETHPSTASYIAEYEAIIGRIGN